MEGQRQAWRCLVAVVVAACTPQREQPSPGTAEPPRATASGADTSGADAAASAATAAASATPSATASAANAAKPGPGEDFESGEAGALPSGWTAPIGAWRLETADDATSGGQVLLQHAKGPSAQFNVALAPGDPARDVTLRVKLRARDGRIDQGGGVVWRAEDGRNYYIARYNPLEDNYRVYVVKNGRRKQLGSADVSVARDGWHEVSVTMKGDHITCALDGKALLDVHDATFGEPGAVGVWTKADAQTVFDDFAVTRLDATDDGDDGDGDDGDGKAP